MRPFTDAPQTQDTPPLAAKTGSRVTSCGFARSSSSWAGRHSTRRPRWHSCPKTRRCRRYAPFPANPDRVHGTTHVPPGPRPPYVSEKRDTSDSGSWTSTRVVGVVAPSQDARKDNVSKCEVRKGFFVRLRRVSSRPLCSSVFSFVGLSSDTPTSRSPTLHRTRAGNTPSPPIRTQVVRPTEPGSGKWDEEEVGDHVQVNTTWTTRGTVSTLADETGTHRDRRALGHCEQRSRDETQQPTFVYGGRGNRRTLPERDN